MFVVDLKYLPHIGQFPGIFRRSFSPLGPSTLGLLLVTVLVGGAAISTKHQQLA